MQQIQCSFDTKIGVLRAFADELGLIALLFNNDIPYKNIDAHACASTFSFDIESRIHDYLNGELTAFDIPISPRFDEGYTPFQRAVWRQLMRITYGQVITYGQLACAVGHPSAYRAVGNANGKNPISIIIPCHRVVASHGLGGYGGGIEIKRRLLNIEGVIYP